jgi:HSP20 family protein
LIADHVERRFAMDLIPWRNKSRSPMTALDRPLASFRAEFENLFDRFFREPWGTSALSSVPGMFPQLDMAETDNDVTIRAELPGVRPEDVRIEVTGNILKLSGEKGEQKEEKGRDCLYCERQFGVFSRLVQLPASVDPNQVDATYKDGVLIVTMNKHPEAKPKRITVRNA